MLETVQVFYLGDDVSVQNQYPQVLQAVAFCDEWVYFCNPVKREVHVIEIRQANQILYLGYFIGLQVQMAQLLLPFKQRNVFELTAVKVYFFWVGQTLTGTPVNNYYAWNLL